MAGGSFSPLELLVCDVCACACLFVFMYTIYSVRCSRCFSREEPHISLNILSLAYQHPLFLPPSPLLYSRCQKLMICNYTACVSATKHHLIAPSWQYMTEQAEKHQCHKKVQCFLKCLCTQAKCAVMWGKSAYWIFHTYLVHATVHDYNRNVTFITWAIFKVWWP